MLDEKEDGAKAMGTAKLYAGHIDQDRELMATWKILQIVGEMDHEGQKRVISYVADRIVEDNKSKALDGMKTMAKLMASTLLGK